MKPAATADATVKETIFRDTMTALERVGEGYLAKTTRDTGAAESWRPRKSLWHRLQQAGHWLPGVKARSEQVGAHRIHFWQVGPDGGTPVVLLHGFGASKENWISLLPGLNRRGMTLYVPDLPGFGQSTYLHTDRYTYDKQAARLALWASHLGAGPAHWAGSSMGGAICATLAAQFPEAVRSITLMNAAGMGAERMSPLDQELMAGSNLLIPENRAQVKRLFLMTTHRHNRLFSALMAPAVHRDMTHRAPVGHHVFADMLQPETPVPELLDKISAPVQIIWGEEDRIVDVSSAYRYAALIADARVEIMPGIGHLPMLEAPVRTARVMRHFWKEIGERP